MTNEERFMHFIAGAAYGELSTCFSRGKPKIKYGSEETAVKAATSLSSVEKTLEAYPCFFCYDWHIGRAMTSEERILFMVFTDFLYRRYDKDV